MYRTDRKGLNHRPVTAVGIRVGCMSLLQIIGETATGDMLNVNPTKSKELTNFRNKGKEDHIVLQVCSRPFLLWLHRLRAVLEIT